jgi:hypothetical protein
MKLLTATSRTQGQRDNDFNFCIEGELVIVAPLVCETDRLDPDGGCGCGRSFGGLNSGKATTTAVVSDLPLTPADAALAVRSALEQSNFIDFMQPEKVDDVITDTLELADSFDVGTIVEQRLGDVRARS